MGGLIDLSRLGSQTGLMPVPHLCGAWRRAAQGSASAAVRSGAMQVNPQFNGAEMLRGARRHEIA